MTALSLLLALPPVDPRLDVRASLDVPRLTYAEFGAWVQKTTGATVRVAPGIRERKVTVLVDDRPVRETMDRVADTLFLEWEPTEGGYTLRLPPKVAAEEAAALAAIDNLHRRGLRDRLDELARLAGRTPAEIAAMRDAARDEDLAAPGLAGKDRLARLSAAAASPAYSALGSVLASLGPDRWDALIDGGRAFASDAAGGDVVAIAPATAARLASAGLNGEAGTVPGLSTGGFATMPSAGSRAVVMLSGDPKWRALQAVVGFLAPDGQASGYSIALDAGLRQTTQAARYDTALAKRMLAWSGEPPDREAWTRPLAAPKRPLRPATLHTLADLLVDLHARTGLPIVADAFREAARGAAPPAGEAVWEWANALYAPSTDGGPYSAPRTYPALLARASKGWIQVRRQFYPEALAKEVPEGTIRPLEAAVRSHGASLDDVAAFAAALTPSQGAHLEDRELVMDAPNEAVRDNVAILRAWRGLPASLQREAQKKDGLVLAPGMPGFAGFMDALADRCAESSDPSLLALLLPGASLPEPPRLFVAHQRGGDPNSPTYLFEMRLGGRELASYTVPLGPRPTSL